MLKVTILLQNPLRHISGKSGDFRGSSCGEEGNNVWTNQRPRQQSWISNCSPSGTFVVRLVTENAVVLKKKLNRHMDLQTDDRTDRSLTPFTWFFLWGLCSSIFSYLCCTLQIIICPFVFFLWPFHWLFFDLQLLYIPLISSKFSYKNASL